MESAAACNSAGAGAAWSSAQRRLMRRSGIDGNASVEVHRRLRSPSVAIDGRRGRGSYDNGGDDGADYGAEHGDGDYDDDDATFEWTISVSFQVSFVPPSRTLGQRPGVWDCHHDHVLHALLWTLRGNMVTR